jgi:hypothetical protein
MYIMLFTGVEMLLNVGNYLQNGDMTMQRKYHLVCSVNRGPKGFLITCLVHIWVKVLLAIQYRNWYYF